jgi:ABC-type lipoprotein export system ATPase subunit
MTVPAVELRDVFCVHRTPEGDAAALQGATLTVDRGEVLGVIGPSGAGKSTLLRMIAGLQTPSAGAVVVLGRDIGRLKARARAQIRHDSIGFLGQRADSLLPPELPVWRAVSLPLALRGEPADARRARALELLEAVGLRNRADTRPDQLSGGERARVALCAALSHRPALLLADEPTGELDVVSAAATRAVIGSLARATGTTAIIVSHDPATEAFVDRCVQISDGRVAEDRRDGDGALVVGRGGWVQLPAELLEAAGIGDRVRVHRGEGGLVVTSVSEPRSAPQPAARQHPAAMPTDAGWSAATVATTGVTRIRGTGAARRTVLDTLTQSFGPGGLIAVTGPSGTGKTTLLRLLAGLDRPDAGELSIDRTPIDGWNDEQRAALRRDRIGYLPQEPSPIGFLSAHENVALALALRGYEEAEANERASATLIRAGLEHRASQRVARLSAGEAQRVALARAVACARGLLLVDEPTSRLDRASAAATAELLATAAAHDEQTVICATHDPELIERADVTLALK